MATVGKWGTWARAEQLRRVAAEQGLWLEQAGDKGDRAYWLLVDAVTSRVVAGVDPGHPDMRLADVEAYLARHASEAHRFADPA